MMLFLCYNKTIITHVALQLDLRKKGLVNV